MARKHRWMLIGCLTAYTVLIAISLEWLQHADPGAPWKYLIAAVPVIPALMVPVIVARAIRELDELQRKIQFEALAFGFSATAVLSLGYGFLENAGIPQLNWVWVWPLMGVCWAGGLAMARRKYS